MPLNPNIALGIQYPEQDDPVSQYGKLLSLRNLTQRNKLQQESLRKAELARQNDESELADLKVFNQVFQKHSGAGQADWDAIEAELGQMGRGTAALSFAKQIRDLRTADWTELKAQSDARKALGQEAASLYMAIFRDPGRKDELNSRLREMNAPEALDAGHAMTLLHSVQEADKTSGNLLALQRESREQQGQQATIRHQQEMEKPEEWRLYRLAQEQQPGLTYQAFQQRKQGTEPALAMPQPIQGSPPGSSQQEILSKYPANVQGIAKSLLSYSIPFPGAFALSNPKSPYHTALLAVQEIDPTWSATEYPSRLKMLQDFKSGKAAANVRSLNTLIGHLDSLKKAADQLDNRSLQSWNWLANRLISEVGDPRVTNFEKAMIAVQNEASTLFKGTGATDQEIKEWRATMNASQSPQQLEGGIRQMVDLMGSRLEALTQQYQIGMGKPIDFRLLNDKSMKILDSLGMGDLEYRTLPQGKPPKRLVEGVDF